MVATYIIHWHFLPKQMGSEGNQPSHNGTTTGNHQWFAQVNTSLLKFCINKAKWHMLI